MRGIITTEVEAKSLQDIVSKSLGYPKVGVSVGGGSHASVEESTTLCYTDVIQHPSNFEMWVLPVDDVVQNIVNDDVAFGLLTSDERDSLWLALQNVQELSSDWFPIKLQP